MDCERLSTGIDWSKSGHINQLTFVNDALEADDGEESAGNGGGGNGTQNDQTKQTAGVAARLALEEEVGTARGRNFGGHVLRKWEGISEYSVLVTLKGSMVGEECRRRRNS
jgi:hypothetical protein